MNRTTATFLAGLVLTAGLSACGSSGPTYASCAAAKEAGATLPLLKGDPGYSKKLDADGDGTACDSKAK